MTTLEAWIAKRDELRSIDNITAQEDYDDIGQQLAECDRAIAQLQKRPQPSNLIDTIRELLQVAEWHQTLYNDIRAIAPEYFERHPDLNAVNYLEIEAATIQQRAQDILAVWEGEPESEPELEWYNADDDNSERLIAWYG